MARLFTQSQAAAMLGVSQSAISRAIQNGRLKTVKNDDGKPCLDADTLLDQWNATTSRPIKVRSDGTLHNRHQRKPHHPNDPYKGDYAATLALPTGSDVPDYAESKARTEYLKAELLELQRREKEGQLIDAEKLRKDSFALGNQVKELLMGVADRLAHMCAAEDDPAKVHQYITDEHRNALRAFCDAAD
ncbi:MAG: hypothetical protein ACO29V_02880 [Limnohabitans sp.]